MRGPEPLELQLAQAAPGGGGEGPGFGFFLPLIAMFLLLYALVIRPQSRQQKDQKKMHSELQRGDHVVTSGGMHGRVTGISEDVLTVEIAERVRVKVNRSAIVNRLPGAEAKEKKG
jgi:preprotein translocase subunit YajC